MGERNGRRKTREQQAKKRIPKLGYYIIITDTKKTEENYIKGFRDSIPKELQGKIVIKVSKTKTEQLVDEAYELASLQPQYSEPWIVFDRDKVKDFDKIIIKATDMGIHAAWSNPCIEIWFNAYFGEMPVYLDSVKCCDGFSSKFSKVTGQEYKKSDPDLYQKLNYYGDERKAIQLAEKKKAEHKKNCNILPSKMNPCTTLHELLKEIKSKARMEKM